MRESAGFYFTCPLCGNLFHIEYNTRLNRYISGCNNCNNLLITTFLNQQTWQALENTQPLPNSFKGEPHEHFLYFK